MERRSSRPESHVAQQSQRDKLRDQQSLTSDQHFDDCPNSLEEMLNFATSSHALSAPKVSIVDQELGAVPLNRPILAEESSLTGMSHPVLSNFNASPKASSCDPQGCCNWRSLDSHQSYDLMATYAGGSVVGGRNQKPMFVGEVSSNNARISNISTSRQYLMPSYIGNQNLQLPSTLRNTFGEISSEDSIKQLKVMMQSPSPPPYQNALQDVIPSGCFRSRMNERVLHPSYVTESTASHFDNNGSTWMSRPLEDYPRWSTGELGLVERTRDRETRTVLGDANTQGLSLSLSSINPPSEAEATQFGEEYASEHLQSKVVDRVSQESHQDSEFSKPSSPCALPKPSIINKSWGKSIHDIVGTSTHAIGNNTAPLGPFTGYATVLKSSKFLKPAQQLLEEFSLVEQAGTNAENYSGIQSSTFYRSNKPSGGGDAGGSGGSYGFYGPEYQQEKAKLLFLQEEVCRRYKQYHQQIQMVAASFESVASLSVATPYVSVALKTVYSNFRSLKHGISGQLRLVTKALGDSLFSRNTVAGGSKGDARLLYMDQRNKSGGARVGYREPQQHIWRPQRGLPESSVAILRAWLFEHFLHPYPTDTDKHMLATQTGLSRNQVSNWFINARVRVWKPMVEEIHMLEIKGLAEISGEIDGISSAEGNNIQSNHEETSNKLGSNSMLNKRLECSGIGSSGSSGEQLDEEQWSEEKRSRVEFQIPTTMDGSLMNFLPYQRSGVDDGGAVSLTLGLRQGIEIAQHQIHWQQHRGRFKQQPFGGHMIHDFAG
ncbi:BEL1-LIKE HOMEODOMAIN PROTEIN 8 [Salix koriyanagi]|uniref:BEL1-LIKE HOMEODOMAIN PROTEIN 8 n=1 Tax=Salix koriyanagi TaxID=2511006 RepID=A0A9Q0YZC7_9ROSI|nr:BEL1-LIKE HOMEODOMAIN PROTEIN 8 [Salix koriyanagi]